jgi:hypothetical protein
VSSSTVVATANILYSLTAGEACRALADVLAHEPDLVGLQEWYPTRIRLLRGSGEVALVPYVAGRLGRRTGGGGVAYCWNAPLLGGCAVGARADRYDLLGARSHLLSRPGRADRDHRFLGLEPARFAMVTVCLDRCLARTVALVDYHLVSGVQAHGQYRTDRPVLVERHRHEVRRLERLVESLLAEGHVVHAVGDSNLDGLRISGLTSAWQGQQNAPGTLGRRHVDDVHGPGRADAVAAVRTASDHRALVVRRPDAP